MIRRLLSRFLRDECGGVSTIEFVILFPAFVAVFTCAYETGVIMVRDAMLERAVDIAVRDLRLGTTEPPSFDEFKEKICASSFSLKDCAQVIQVELEPVDRATWTGLTGEVKCIDRTRDIDPIDETRYAVGSENDMMLVRVCALYKPFFSPGPFAMKLPRDSTGHYALVATSAFVNEPG